MRDCYKNCKNLFLLYRRFGCLIFMEMEDGWTDLRTKFDTDSLSYSRLLRIRRNHRINVRLQMLKCITLYVIFSLLIRASFLILAIYIHLYDL